MDGWTVADIGCAMVGQTISHYRILSQLGSGGMGVVYSAEHVLLGRPVAIKFVSADLAGDSHAIERFRVEARAASALNHANICTIHDFGEHEGRPFIVMELMKGQTVRDRLDNNGPLKIAEVIDLGIQIADALDVAHAHGIVHRDIKPANLFLTDRGQVKILDFGVAKLVPRPGSRDTTDTPLGSSQSTAFGATVGTVWYMSPEQATGEKLDGRSDLFSLGIVLYECVTGHPPFVGKTAAVVLSAILNRTPTSPTIFNPEIPPRLEEVISNCLEKDRELRYQAAADLRADLKRVKRDLESGQSVAAKRSAASTPPAGEPVPEIRQASSDQALPAPSKGSRRTTAVVAGVLAVAVGAAAYALWPRAAPAPATPANTGLVGELSEALVQSRLELATASFNARNYRAAITAAGEVLRAAPNHAAATKIRDEAQAMLTRLDESVADARRLVAAGNAEGAARALDAARAIDPNAAGIAEVAAQLVDHYKGQANAAREGEQRARAAQQRPPAALAPAPRPPAQVTPASPSPSPPNQPAPLNQAPATQAAPPSPAPAVEPPPAPPPPPKMVTPPVTPEPVRRPDPAPATPAPAPPERREPPPAPSAADDESAIRRVIGTYARAIETKDLGLFRSVKPNMSREEQQRISDGFRAVSSQQVDITILSIERRGDTAMVRLRRRDTVEASGRRQTTESQQTMTLTRAGDGWVIGEIGR